MTIEIQNAFFSLSRNNCKDDDRPDEKLSNKFVVETTYFQRLWLFTESIRIKCF